MYFLFYLNTSVEQTDLLLNSSESYINISIFVYAMFFAAKTNVNPHLNSLILDKIILPNTETDFENNRGSKGGWAQFTNVQNKLMKDETRRSNKIVDTTSEK